MSIKSLIKYDKFLTIDVDVHIKTINKKLLNNSFFVVVNDEGVYLGILSKVDLIFNSNFIVGDCFSKRHQIKSNASLEYVLSIFNEGIYDEYPVFEDDSFIGVISKKKVLNYLSNFFKDQKLAHQGNKSIVSYVNDKEVYDNELNLLSIIAHDLVDPFNALLGISSFVLENFNEFDSDELQKNILSINKSANTNYQLTRKLLSWSLTHQKGIVICKKNINIHNLLNEIIESVHPLVLQKNINIINNCDKYISLELDKNIISNIIYNLLSNAIKFSDQNSFIKINVFSNDNQFVIEVVDRGCGMTEKKMKSLNGPIIFDVKSIFNNAHGYQGGYGLYYCKKLIALHKGRLIFESVLNEGTVARIKLVS